MYFSILPNINYDLKPQSFPFSSADFVVVNNFFRRYTLSEDIFDYATYYGKYAVKDGERIDWVASNAYGDPELDWIVALVNNMTNVYEDWPMSNSALQEWAESTYGSDVYSQIAYYEISSDVKNSQNGVIYKKGQKVDLKFYNSNHDYNNGDISNTTITVSGQNISAPVTVWEDELRKNEAKREIYILKQPYIEPLLSELRKQSTYKKCSAYVNKKLKSTLK